jgi:hypothetical protein
MISTQLQRWSALMLLPAGVLTAIGVALHPAETDLLNSAWVPVHSVLVIAVVLSLFGLIGLYGRLAEKGGVIGLIGFVLSFIGSALFVAALSFEAFVAPGIAASSVAATLLSDSGPLFGGLFGLVLLFTSSAFALGMILLGVSILRTRALLRWAGILLIVGAPLLAFWPPLPHIAGTLGALALGIGYAWLGYALWVRTAEQVIRTKAAA